jgi:hypothetical protein
MVDLMTSERAADVVASCWLVGAVVWVLGNVVGAWTVVAVVLAVWVIMRGLPVWAPSVLTAWSILFGERYSASETIEEILADVEDDVREELVPQILEAARRVHNWASRVSAALIALIGLLAMWAARDAWQPFVFVLFGSAVVISATWPAIKRRWDERDA